MPDEHVDEQIRVGLIGGGPWARQVHAPGLADHPGLRLASVWNRRPEASAEIAGAYGAEVAASPAELIDSVDAVVFAVPPETQAELGVLAANAGKHLILEKPLAGTVDGAERLAGAIADAGVAALVVLIRRFAPETVDWLGELRRLGGWAGGSCRWLSGALLSETYGGSGWRHAGGALLDIGPHVFDLMDAALGRIEQVVGVTRTEPDLWQVMFTHEGGATSTAAMSLRLPMRPTVVDFAVYGEHGFRSLPGRDTPAESCYTALLDDFVAMVHSGTTSHPCDAQRGLHLQRVLDTVARQAAE